MFVACCPPSTRSLKLDVVRLTGCGTSGPTESGKTRLCRCLTVITKRLEHFRGNIDVRMTWDRIRRPTLERSVLSERLKTQGCHRRIMLPMQFESDKRRRSKVYRTGGVGWLKSFVRENVVETDETASGGSKLIVPYHWSWLTAWYLEENSYVNNKRRKIG